MTENINQEYLSTLKIGKVLVLGLGKRSGVAVANLLFKLGVEYAISDSKTKDALSESVALLKDKSAEIYFGEQTPSQLDGVNLVVLSPGVPAYIPIVKEAENRGVKVISEVEFAYRLLADNIFVAITGTDGKTTTTSLLSDMLSTTYTVHTAGNIGVAVSAKIEEIKKGDVVLLELSSFQLETIDKFAPKAAAILNVSEDHLDRYNGMDDYYKAKKRIFMNQNEDDVFVYNLDNAYTKLLHRSSEFNATAHPFSKEILEAYAHLKDGVVYCAGERYVDPKGAKLKGSHNIENILAACAICSSLGVEKEDAERAVLNFSPVEHRMEFVCNVNGVSYYNDSKATTLQAVEKALLSFDSGLVLMMGGRNKGLDFSPLADIMKGRVKVLVLTGEAADEIYSQLDFTPKMVVSDFDKAVFKCAELAENGDVVLFSSGCTSFDRFKNYEERGKYFKTLVNSKLKENNNESFSI